MKKIWGKIHMNELDEVANDRQGQLHTRVCRLTETNRNNFVEYFLSKFRRNLRERNKWHFQPVCHLRANIHWRQAISLKRPLLRCSLIFAQSRLSSFLPGQQKYEKLWDTFHKLRLGVITERWTWPISDYTATIHRQCALCALFVVLYTLGVCVALSIT